MNKTAFWIQTTRVIRVVAVLLLFFGCISGKGIVYIFDLDIDLAWANSEQSKGDVMGDLREALIRLGYTPIWIHSVYDAHDYDYLLAFNLYQANAWQKKPKEKSVAFLWEPPTVRGENYDKRLHKHFFRVYTWNDALVDNKQYFKFYYPRYTPAFGPKIPFQEKKLCTMIVRNKNSKHSLSLYGERRKLIRFFEQYLNEDFDLYGHGWENSELKNYRGAITSKFDCMRNYRFCFAYENMHDVDGYVSEKILDAFKVGCVPVYWGASNIEKYVPKNCFIDRRDFDSNEQLYRFLQNVSEDEYKHYLDNIKKFFDSDQVLLFSQANFVDIALNAIEPGYDRSVGLTERQRVIIERIERYKKEQGYK